MQVQYQICILRDFLGRNCLIFLNKQTLFLDITTHKLETSRKIGSQIGIKTAIYPHLYSALKKHRIW